MSVVPDRRTAVRVTAAVAVGGALGAAARHGVAHLVPTEPGAFPWATLVTNVSGAFALAVLGAAVTNALVEHHPLRVLLTTGLLSSYTTFSTFAVEAAELVRDGHAPLAAGYVVVSLVAGLVVVILGSDAGSRIVASLPPFGHRR
ncbi:MAG: CrcB family protein [Actinomycetota bacterium]|nr:CrcB family protein [Actinomycetota bacterium]